MFLFFILFMSILLFFFFFSSRRRHTRWPRDWSSDVCSSDLLLDVIAEGVETIQQVALLKKLHCKYGQGFYFSKPLSAEGTKALLTGDLAWQAYQPSK